MGPHKDPAKLPVDDQLKLLRDTVDEINSEVTFHGMRLRSIDDQLKVLRTDVKDVGKEIKGLDKRFDKQERLFEKWKNQILTALDKSFTKPIFDLQNDSAASLFRQKVQQEEVDKLKVKVFGSATV